MFYDPHNVLLTKKTAFMLQIHQEKIPISQFQLPTQPEIRSSGHGPHCPQAIAATFAHNYDGRHPQSLDSSLSYFRTIEKGEQ